MITSISFPWQECCSLVNRETGHNCAGYSTIMLKLTMCAAGQKFPTHSLDAWMEADQSEATTYYGYDTNITLSKPGQKFPTHGLDRHTKRATAALCMYVVKGGGGGGHSTGGTSTINSIIVVFPRGPSTTILSSGVHLLCIWGGRGGG